MGRMISYAQNREDVLLQRVLADCPYRQYVDVGAGHPTIHSVTRHFHDEGWSGVNIEPRPEMFHLLCLSRTADVNLRIGVSDEPGVNGLRLITVDGVTRAEGGGLSTFDPHLADAQRGLGRGVETIPTDTQTLSSVFEEFVSKSVSFLKIDVEGYERKVIAGMNWRKWRPRVVLVEAIDPITQRPNHHQWEPHLVGNGYLPAHWDGLNRFYVREEDEDLLSRFASPVSVLDSFVPHESLRLQQQIAQLRDDNNRVLNAMLAQQERSPSKAMRRVRRLVRHCLPNRRADDESSTASSQHNIGPAGPRDGRLLLEVTSTSTADVHTGIQRVVRNVAHHTQEHSRAYGLKCQPVRLQGDEYLPVSMASKRNGWAQWTWTGICRGYRGTASSLCRIAPIPGLRRQLLPPPGRRGIFKVPWTILQKIKKTYSAVAGPRIRYQKDDVLVLLDATWGIPVWPAVARAQRAGVTIAAVVYDLIPVSHPQFFRTELADAFRLWLHAAAERVDYFVTISETVATQLRDYLETNHAGLGRQFCVRSFPLGATLDKVEQQTRVRDELKRIFKGPASTYLSVGTVEPRKNHVFLLNAFEQVWRKHPSAQLCVVGRLGWLCDDIVRRFRDHPRHGKTLFLMHDVSDAELSYCYRHAKALTYPSIIEGYGLPLIEALQYHLPVFAADTPIHREVCGEFAEYFSLTAPASLAGMIQEVEAGPTLVAACLTPRYKPMSWEESCCEFLKANLSCLSELEQAKIKSHANAHRFENNKAA